MERCCITFVSDSLGKRWKELGRQLRVDDTTIENIESEHREQKEKGYQVVSVWKKAHGRRATIELLTDALKRISRNDLGEDLIKHWQEKHRSVFEECSEK